MKNKTDLPKAGAIAIAGIWVMAAAVSVLSASHGSGYDVLDKIADSTSVGVSLEEKISDRIDASTSDMTYYLKRLDTLMCDYRAEKVTEDIRPDIKNSIFFTKKRPFKKNLHIKCKRETDYVPIY